MEPRDREVVRLEWELANAKKEIERLTNEVFEAVHEVPPESKDEYTNRLEDDNAALALLVRDFARSTDALVKLCDRGNLIVSKDETYTSIQALRDLAVKSRELP